MNPQPTVTACDVFPWGFQLMFDQPIDPADVRLYDGGAGHVPRVPWLLLEGVLWGGSVAYGSLVLSADRFRLIYIYTFGLLPDDTWTVSIPALGYTHQFATTYTADAVGLVIASFARGPGQIVDLLANGSIPEEPIFYGGIPIALTDGDNVKLLQFSLTYDTALLNVTGALVDKSMPQGATFVRTARTVVNRIATDTFTFTSPSPLLRGCGATLGQLRANIPNEIGQAIYGATQQLRVTNIICDGTPNVVGVDGLQVVAYIGNVTGTGSYSAEDAALIGRKAGGCDSGFEAFPCVDPTLLADVLTEYSVSIGDAALVSQKAGLYVESIPNIPAGAQVAAFRN